MIIFTAVMQGHMHTCTAHQSLVLLCQHLTHLRVGTSMTSLEDPGESGVGATTNLRQVVCEAIIIVHQHHWPLRLSVG